jgi:hypothetical protein
MAKNTRASVIVNQSRTTKRSSTRSFVSDIGGSSSRTDTTFTAAMNLLNLVQNLIIVSTLCVMHSFVNSLVSDRWVTGWINDSRATNRGSRIGSQLLRVLYRILGPSKPNHLDNPPILDIRAAL